MFLHDRAHIIFQSAWDLVGIQTDVKCTLPLLVQILLLKGPRLRNNCVIAPGPPALAYPSRTGIQANVYNDKFFYQNALWAC